jgi:hypothetical protein
MDIFGNEGGYSYEEVVDIWRRHMPVVIEKLRHPELVMISTSIAFEDKVSRPHCPKYIHPQASVEMAAKLVEELVRAKNESAAQIEAGKQEDELLKVFKGPLPGSVEFYPRTKPPSAKIDTRYANCLEELRKAEIRDDQIRFVAAIGAHRPLDSRELVAKLGRSTVQRYRVFCHNAFDHLVHVGTTTRGTRVLLNREVANCDYKIGVGCVIPHLSAGFSGGGEASLRGCLRHRNPSAQSFKRNPPRCS